MPVRRDLYEEQIAAREAEARDAEREVRRAWLLALGVCMVWCVLGAAVTTAGFVVHGEELGRALVDLGQVVAAVGVLGTVAHTSARLRGRGYE